MLHRSRRSRSRSRPGTRDRSGPITALAEPAARSVLRRSLHALDADRLVLLAAVDDGTVAVVGVAHQRPPHLVHVLAGDAVAVAAAVRQRRADGGHEDLARPALEAVLARGIAVLARPFARHDGPAARYGALRAARPAPRAARPSVVVAATAVAAGTVRAFVARARRDQHHHPSEPHLDPPRRRGYRSSTGESPPGGALLNRSRSRTH